MVSHPDAQPPQAGDAGSPSIDTADLVVLARVSDAHGIRGWLKLHPYAQDGEALLSAKTWWLAPPAPVIPGQAPDAARPGQDRPGAARPDAARPHQVLTCRWHGAHLIAHLDGMTDRSQAEALRGSLVLLPRAHFPEPDEDEYYWVDLVGCRLYGRQGDEAVLLGVVDEVLDNGAHAVLKVQRRDADGQVLLDSRGRAQETLVPFVKAHVHAVDLAGRRIDSDWPAEF